MRFWRVVHSYKKDFEILIFPLFIGLVLGQGMAPINLKKKFERTKYSGVIVNETKVK